MTFTATEKLEAVQRELGTPNATGILVEFTDREFATVRAALLCWREAFDQARDESVGELYSEPCDTWPEWNLATGDGHLQPLDEEEIGVLETRLGEMV